MAKAKKVRPKEEPKEAEPIYLDVPFYRQTQDFTCGPACVMMAMAYFDYGVEMGKDLEIDIWREAHPGEIYGTIRYGLALAAKKRGFGASILSNTKELEFLDFIKQKYPNASMKRLDFFFEDMEARCQNAGVLIDTDDVTMEIIEDTMRQGHIPIVLMTAAIFTNEDVPHWVVICGLDLERMTITLNNPLGEGPETLTLERFHDGYGWRGKEVMVSIYEQAFPTKKGKK
jgi:ABC-type bacteriocin/lantibiotic exporter with double-glycine peptidase domain